MKRKASVFFFAVMAFGCLANPIFAMAQKDKPEKRPVYFNYDSTSFSATGKWVSTSPDPKDQPPFPAEVEIDCFKNNVCIEAIAEYYMGNPHISVLYFDVVTWDGNGILAKSSHGSPCVTGTLLINFADKSISANDALKNVDDKMKKACAFFGVEKSQSSVFVLKGSERWEQEHWKNLLPASK